MKKFNFKDNIKTYSISAMITALVMAIVSSPVDVIKTRIMSSN